MADDPRQRQIETVKAVYDAFARRDVDAAIVHFAPDFELRPGGTSAVTGRQVYRGYDGIRDYYEDAVRVWAAGIELEPTDYRAVAGSVVVFGRVHGVTEQGPFESEVVWVWRSRGELLVSCQVYATRQAALAAAQAG